MTRTTPQFRNGSISFEKFPGEGNLMWSNDFPHPNSTWPNSLKVIQRDLGHLSVEAQTKVLATNVCKLYGLDPAALPAGVSTKARAAKAA